MNVVNFLYGQASANLIKVDRSTYAVRSVYSRVRQQGHARALMQKIVDYADLNHLTLILEVRRYGYSDSIAMDNKQLEEFYSSFGFVRTGESDKPVAMVRPRSQNLHVL